VSCQPLADLAPDAFHRARFDVVVVVSASGRGAGLRRRLPDATRLVMWVHLDADQPRVADIASDFDHYDRFVLLSAFQRRRYADAFGMPADRVTLLPNAIAPAFAALLDTPPARPPGPPMLAYTSTPFRGLRLLLDAFPRIRAAVPDATLAVFSSLEVYRVDAAEDQHRYGALYQRCRATPGVAYLGGQPQTTLARLMSGMHLFAYPCIFPETSCISVVEAMAAGMQAVTSDLGALPETCGGYADLVPFGDGDGGLARDVAEAGVAALRRSPAEIAGRVVAQRAYLRETRTWPVVASRWEALFADLCGAA
jgi:glycosyltransferase involved in cell wall biosynthesis